MAHCNQCGIDWTPRVDKPRACTRCKRYDWAEPKKGVGDAEIKAGGGAGVEKDTVSPAGERGVRKGAAGDRGELLRGESVSGAAAAKAEAVAPEWKCVCGSTGKRMKGKELVCFSCGRGA